VRNRTTARLVNNDCARSSEHECKRADKFCAESFHRNNRQASIHVSLLLSTQQRENDMNFSAVATAAVAAD
jgi:hypothetical protein